MSGHRTSSPSTTTSSGRCWHLRRSGWLVNFVYSVGFLKAVQGTPGKLITGLRVRLRERPGSLPWATVLLRWLVQNAGSIVAVVPLVGSAGSLFSLLDSLWPLWDDKNQALHDKAARTNVVRVRD